jgi:hypothetical protein
VYQKDWIRVRLVVDRGFRSVEVSSGYAPDVWLDLQAMINRAWNRDDAHVVMQDEFALFLVENFEALKAILRHNNG